MGKPILAVVLIFILYLISNKKFIFLNRNYTKKECGDIGERIVSNILYNLDDRYVVENDLRFDGIQIDHIVEYENIVFVIETKKWSGKVTGRKNDAKWCQNKRGCLEYYKNPIKQNEMHISRLKIREIGKYIVRNDENYEDRNCDEYENMRDKEYVNIVVFVENRNVPKLKNVIQEYELYDYIRGYVSKVNKVDNRVNKVSCGNKNVSYGRCDL